MFTDLGVGNEAQNEEKDCHSTLCQRGSQRSTVPGFQLWGGGQCSRDGGVVTVREVNESMCPFVKVATGK